MGLIVEILWVVFALGVGAAEKRGIALVTHTMEHGKLFSGSAERQTSALHTCGKCALKCFWFLVGDIEHRRHFVAVFGVETTGGECHRAHHIGVDDAETLLLSRTHQLWAMHLYAVDIHAVLVVATATHHVLRTHLTPACVAIMASTLLPDALGAMCIDSMSTLCSVLVCFLNSVICTPSSSMDEL